MAENDLKAFTTSFSTVAVAPPSLLDPRPGDVKGATLDGESLEGVMADVDFSAGFEVEMGAGIFGLSVFSEFKVAGALLFSFKAAIGFEDD